MSYGDWLFLWRELFMSKEQQNVYVVEVDMKEKSVKDIAREAALQIIGITDALIEQQKQFKEAQKEKKQ